MGQGHRNARFLGEFGRSGGQCRSGAVTECYRLRRQFDWRRRNAGISYSSSASERAGAAAAPAATRRGACATWDSYWAGRAGLANSDSGAGARLPGSAREPVRVPGPGLRASPRAHRHRAVQGRWRYVRRSRAGATGPRRPVPPCGRGIRPGREPGNPRSRASAARKPAVRGLPGRTGRRRFPVRRRPRAAAAWPAASPAWRPAGHDAQASRRHARSPVPGLPARAFPPAPRQRADRARARRNHAARDGPVPVPVPEPEPGPLRQARARRRPAAGGFRRALPLR